MAELPSFQCKSNDHWLASANEVPELELSYLKHLDFRDSSALLKYVYRVKTARMQVKNTNHAIKIAEFLMQASQSCPTLIPIDVFRVKRLLPLSKESYKPAVSTKRFFSPLSEGAGLVHDAKNLLCALGIYAELLTAPDLLSNDCKAYAEEIALIASRSHRLLERLVRCASHPDATRPHPAAVSEIVERNRDLLSRVVGRSIHFSITPSTDHPIQARCEIIERILLNLVKNAAAATPISGSIEVIVEEGRMPDRLGRRYVSLTVRDNGIGMSKSGLKDLQKNRCPITKSGRGMGFRIVSELVAESGGCLKIDSTQGEGTKVSVRWLEKRWD